MNRIQKIIYMSILVFLSACGSVENSSGEDILLKSSLAQKPEWAGMSGTMKNGGATMFVGRASGVRSESDAISVATNDAFSKLSNHFGVSVKSDFVSSEQEVNGQYSYKLGLESKITGSQVKVKNYNIQGTYTEQWKRSSKEFDAYVLLSVPDDEITKIRVEVEGAGSWVVITNIEEAISNTRDFLQILSKKRGIKFHTAPAPISPDADVSKAFEKVQTAYLLTVKCSVAKSEEYSGEFYTVVITVAELISLIDGKVIERWNSEAKGGAFSRNDSINKGVQESFKNIVDKL